MKVTLTPEPSTERTDMTDLSADLALADAEARESRERERFETEAWLIRLSGGTFEIEGGGKKWTVTVSAQPAGEGEK